MPNQPKTGRITAIAAQAKTRRHLGERVNIFIDGDYSFSLDTALIEKFQLGHGFQVDAITLERLLQADGDAKVRARALHFLSYRPRSRDEVRQRLIRDGWAEDVVDRVLDKLREQGYLNDAVFAGLWVEHRTLGKPRGANALQQELRRKGISKEIISEALPTASQELENAVVTARSILQSKSRQWSNLDDKERQTKLIQTLQRRGFSFPTARAAWQQISDEADSDINT